MSKAGRKQDPVLMGYQLVVNKYRRLSSRRVLAEIGDQGQQAWHHSKEESRPTKEKEENVNFFV